MNGSRRFVLLDRDGTINVEHHYLSDPNHITLLPEAARGLQHMQSLGLGLVVITNQSAIGRKIFDTTRLTQIHGRLISLLTVEGVQLDGIYYCPHLPEDDCACRKPRRGLVDLAMQDLQFDPQHSIVIGDKPCDIELGQNLNATTILVRTGYGAQYEHDPALKPDYLADHLYDAALLIENLLAKETVHAEL